MSVAVSFDLLTNQAGTSVNGTPADWPGGMAQVGMVGTFDSATVTIAILGPDGSTYITTGISFTAAGAKAGYIPPGLVRAQVAGGTSPVGLYARLARVADV